ncbi:Uncharacterised protein [Klebsiella pneumoniae]|nr:hypothetical protein M770_15160 [Pseudomonas aeruginosa VRFPA03]SVJ80991.1 Uncharacterised protein [Klebsiella pneumoniae]
MNSEISNAASLRCSNQPLMSARPLRQACSPAGPMARPNSR